MSAETVVGCPITALAGYLPVGVRGRASTITIRPVTSLVYHRPACSFPATSLPAARAGGPLLHSTEMSWPAACLRARRAPGAEAVRPPRCAPLPRSCSMTPSTGRCRRRPWGRSATSTRPPAGTPPGPPAGRARRGRCRRNGGELADHRLGRVPAGRCARAVSTITIRPVTSLVYHRRRRPNPRRPCPVPSRPIGLGRASERYPLVSRREPCPATGARPPGSAAPGSRRYPRRCEARWWFRTGRRSSTSPSTVR